MNAACEQLKSSINVFVTTAIISLSSYVFISSCSSFVSYIIIELTNAEPLLNNILYHVLYFQPCDTL